MPQPSPRTSLTRRISTWLYRRSTFYLMLLLIPPLLWFGVVYLGSLFAMLIQSLYTFDDFSMTILPQLTLDNYRGLFVAANLDIVIRTFAMAAAVSLFCACLGFPIAYYMARHATGWLRGFFYVAVLLPMWASYIVKAYSWTVILAKGGIVYWFIDKAGLTPLVEALLAVPFLGGNTLSTSHLGRFLVFSYVWLPFMILPIQASIERINPNLLAASADLGASPSQTFRTILLPLATPGIVAGSIFTFCLTFGDYIIPTLVGPSGLFIGTMVYTQQGAIGNVPMAAAFTVVPIVVVGLYLIFAKRMGAFDAL
jgi:putative spermidine/putrescine transport system permease protein